MSELEVRFETDEYGCIRCHVMNDGMLLSKHEKEFIIDSFVQLRVENAKLRELVEDMLDCIDTQTAFERVPARWMQDEFAGRARELGIEVDA